MTGPVSSSSLELTSDIVSAYVANNSVRVTDLPALLTRVYEALGNVLNPPPPAVEEAPKATPAQIKKSITPDALISFIDGKPYKSLKRHLTGHGMTPAEYREKFGLPPTYPMVPENYAKARSALAKALGLGQIRRDRAAANAATSDASGSKPAKRGRPRRPKAGRSKAAVE
ncbi:MucR family transcriptional regulator [Methylobacterium sp. WSM2598]|uniref:MucR family transcriptional regulator n=1 Tax=Methylobacterium sp. WSM2598 TaxID=398261 RepID=UPI000363BBC4|nr:MucR family transcriptional regulator [Methylobacterium sp. WSM2598]